MSGRLLQSAPRVLAIFIVAAALVLWLAPRASSAPAGRPSTSGEQMLYDAVNHERRAMGLRELQWDTALANAARLHTALLVDHDALSHRFDGEADLQTRLRLAGASFSLVAENVALAPDVPSLHIAWMNSAPHRANILDPHVNSIGIAIERRGNQLYATQDFSAAVSAMTREEQEHQVARLLQMNGIAPAGGVEEARRSCDPGRGNFAFQPAAIARFETSDLGRLPDELARMISSGRYRHAAVGGCELPAATPFARFRLTVLLYP